MTKNVATLLLAAIVSFTFGCGQKSGSPSEVKNSGPVLTLDPATAGGITGSVTLAGTPPVSNPIDMGAAPPCLKLSTSRIAPIVVANSQGQLANVVVYLKSGLGNYHFSPPRDTAVLDQKACMYDPRVIALMVDQPFEVQNDDPILHNVRPVLKNNKSWAQSQIKGGPPIMASFAHPEFAAHILCNIHPWMRAYLFVFDNPYYAVTSSTGSFELKDVPPGTYTVEAWQERLGVLDQTVTIGPKESKTISFEFKSGA